LFPRNDLVFARAFLTLLKLDLRNWNTTDLISLFLFSERDVIRNLFLLLSLNFVLLCDYAQNTG